MNLSRTRALTIVVAIAALGLVSAGVSGQTRPMCDPDNGGITLPPGFCALVVAENLGVARHMVVAPNGDLYVALMTSGGRGQPETGGGAVALRDANGDGRFEMKETFGSGSTTGIARSPDGRAYLTRSRVKRSMRFAESPNGREVRAEIGRLASLRGLRLGVRLA